MTQWVASLLKLIYLMPPASALAFPALLALPALAFALL